MKTDREVQGELKTGHPWGDHPLDAHAALLHAVRILQSCGRRHHAAGELPMAVALLCHAKRVVQEAQRLRPLLERFFSSLNSFDSWDIIGPLEPILEDDHAAQAQHASAISELLADGQFPP